MGVKKKGRLLYKLLIIILSILIAVDVGNIVISSVIKWEEDKEAIPFSQVKDPGEKAYISLEFMSESFAEFIDESGVELYIAIDDEGMPYIISVDELDINELQPIINYSYSEGEVMAPEIVRVTGNSKVIDGEIKKLAIDAFNEFVGEEVLNDGNFLSYMGNYYLEVNLEIGISSGYIIGSVVVLGFLIIMLILIINKNKRYKEEGKEQEAVTAKASTTDEAFFKEDEVLISQILGEYRAPGSILVKNGRFFFTNYRLLFRQQFRKGFQASIEYEDINYVRRFLIFGVWIYLKDGSKASLRIAFRRSFINEMRKHATVE